MPHFYVQQKDITAEHIFIKGREARHAFLSLRLKPEDEVIVFDGSGKQYQVVVQSLNTRSGIMKIKNTRSVKREKLRVVLAAAIPKKSKFDDLVDKATQLGVSGIIPMTTERTIVRMNLEKAQEKRKRWQRIIIEAAKQSGRVYLPEVEPVQDFPAVLKKVDEFDLALIASLGKDSRSLKSIVRPSGFKRVIVFVGPEGDFSEQELAIAKKSGCLSVSLGKAVLRCDTAVSAILAILNHEWQN